MPSYIAPLQDIGFLLHDVMKVQDSDVPGYGDLDRDFTSAILSEAAKLAQEVLAPLNAAGDTHGCRLEDGRVTTPPGFRQAFDTIRRDGWTSLDCDTNYGGQGLPRLMNIAVEEFFLAANVSFDMYQGLTHAAFSTIHRYGTDEQKALYLPRLAACDWTGTMNLTEPQCGTDLGLVRTRATMQPDGSYQISGEKIFITAGDHDLAENIIHLVLARAPGGEGGTKGLSLFIVPKVLVNKDGSLGERNRVTTTRIETKMGIHGSATCALDYDGASGWLLGPLHGGMAAMFTMMNEARLGVGLQGCAQASAAYQKAAAYARERLQGRAVTGAVNPDGPADPLIVHPDIRRLLMDQKSFIEGARALVLWGASLIDRAERHEDAAERKEADGLVSLLIPVIKGFLTDRGFDSCVAAQQVWGGHGYIEENGLSQFVRDARIAMIYEGANGIQALDLVGRKLPSDGGRHVMALFGLIEREIATDGDSRLATLAEPLQQAFASVQAAVMFFVKKGLKDPNAALAGSTDFLHLTGHVLLGLMWLRMARASCAALDAGTGDAAFHQAKLITARYYMARQLPACAAHLARIVSDAEPVMSLSAEQF